LTYPAHDSAKRYFKDLAWIYRYHDALYQLDHHPEGFEWIVVDDYEQSVFSYMRKSKDETLVIVLNMTPNAHEFYEIGVPYKGEYEELINSDRDIYAGSNQYNPVTLRTIKGERQQFEYYIKPKLGPLTGMIFKYKK
jgi:1,4-alpha-glucan branching enzyme